MTDTKPNLVVEQVRPEQVKLVAPHIMPLLRKACEYSGGRFDPEIVVEACAGLNEKLKWYLWVVFDPDKADAANFGERVKAITVTAIVDYPTGLRMGETILIGGQGPSDEWLHYVDMLKSWARANKAQRIQFVGRRGWQRRMKELGIHWKPVATMYEYELEEGDGRE